MVGEHHLIEKFKTLYHRHYKKFFVLPALAILFCVGVLLFNYVAHGEIVAKGTDLKGGVVATINWNFSTEPNLGALQRDLSGAMGAPVSVSRTDTYSGARPRLVAVDIEGGPELDPVKFKDSIKSALSGQGFETNPADYNIKIVGPAVGAAFLQNTYIALIIGFILMGIVIFFLFRTRAVIATVISCIFFDFLGALAVMDLIGIKLSPLTLASLLMLIGFSIDSDILITTAVLRRHEGHVTDRAFSAMKTGVTMIVAAAASLFALWLFSGTAALRDMTAILLGGLFFDVIHTWFTNLGVLLFIAERKGS
jgi:preprotein translocase subunit SecF